MSKEIDKLYIGKVTRHFPGEEIANAKVEFDKSDPPHVTYEGKTSRINWLPIHYSFLRNPADPDNTFYDSPPDIGTIVMVRQTEINLSHKEYKERGGKQRIEESLDEEAFEFIMNGKK